MDQMDKYSINYLNEELETIWPEWHVIGIESQSPSGGVFRIRKESFGIPIESMLKVIRMDDVTAPDDDQPKAQDMSREIQGSDMAETHALLAPAQDGMWENMQTGAYLQPWTAKQPVSGLVKDDIRAVDIPDALRCQIQIIEALRGVPNVVIIEDYYFKKEEKTASLFVRMELLTNVRELLLDQQERQLVFPVSKVIKMGRDICTALMYCQEKGISHRNIKPENIYVDKFDNFKLGDFWTSGTMDIGYSKSAGQKKDTAYYIAPEVHDRSSYNDTVDTYSLGIILYQILNNGRIPFLPAEGEFSTHEMENANLRRLNGEPLPPLTGIQGADREGKIDADMDAIIRKACAPHAEDRIQNARVFYDALSGCENRLMKKTTNRQDSTVWKAGEQKSWLERFFPGLAAILLLACTILVVRMLIINGSGSLETDGADQSVLETSSETVVEIPDHEDKQDDNPLIGETSTKETEQVISEEKDIIGQLERYGTITDSWQEIIEAGEDGTYLDKYSIGDTKEIDLGQEGVILMELVAMDEDELADDSGFAHMTWIAKDFLNSRHFMNYGETTEGVWEGSDLRFWLRESILPLFPMEVRSHIKTVKKYSFSNYDEETGLIDYTLETPNEVLTEDTIWIPSYKEVFPTVFYEEEEEPFYNIVFSDDASRVRYGIDGSEDMWWLRSADGYSLFHVVREDGRWDMSNVYHEIGVIIGFCL